MNYENSLPLELGFRGAFAEYWSRLKIFLTVLGIASVSVAAIAAGIYIARAHPALVVVPAALSIVTLLVLLLVIALVVASVWLAFKKEMAPFVAVLSQTMAFSVVRAVSNLLMVPLLLRLLMDLLVSDRDREGK